MESIHQSLFFYWSANWKWASTTERRQREERQEKTGSRFECWEGLRSLWKILLMCTHVTSLKLYPNLILPFRFCYSLVSGTCFKGIKDHSKFDILHWNVWKISDTTVKKIQGNFLYIGILLNVHAHVLLNYTQIYLYHRYFLCVKKGLNTGSMLLENLRFILIESTNLGMYILKFFQC